LVHLMRALTASILLCLLYVANATIFRELSLVSLGSNIVVTTLYPDHTTITLTGSSGPSTYNGTNSAVLPISFTFGYANISVQFAYFILTQGSIVIPVQTSQPDCTTVPGVCSCSNSVVDQDYITFPTTGVYTVSIQIILSTWRIMNFEASDIAAIHGSNKWNSLTVTAIRPVPKLLSFSMTSPNTFGCTSATSCLNGVALSANFSNDVLTDDYIFTAYFQAVNDVSAVDINIGGNCVNGDCSPITNPNNIYWGVGFFEPGYLYNYFYDPDSALIAANQTYALTNINIQQGNDVWLLQPPSPCSIEIVNVGGPADTTPPVCYSASFAPPYTMTLGSASAGVVYTVNCTDDNSGVAISGIYMAYTDANNNIIGYNYGEQPQSEPGPVGLPAFVSYTASIIGVFAIDYAGNGVLYGECGSYYDTQTPLLCMAPPVRDCSTHCSSLDCVTSSATPVTASLFGVLIVLVGFHL